MKSVRAKWRLRALAAVGVCFALAALLGCGGGDSNKAAIKGKVTYNGAPVTGGMLTLIPASGDPFPITIKSDGGIDIGDAPVGPMKVTVDTDSASAPTGYVMPPGMQMPKDSKAPVVDAANQPKKLAIPAKYKSADTSGLTWDTKTEKYKEIKLTD